MGVVKSPFFVSVDPMRAVYRKLLLTSLLVTGCESGQSPGGQNTQSNEPASREVASREVDVFEGSDALTMPTLSAQNEAKIGNLPDSDKKILEVLISVACDKLRQSRAEFILNQVIIDELFPEIKQLNPVKSVDLPSEYTSTLIDIGEGIETTFRNLEQATKDYDQAKEASNTDGYKNAAERCLRHLETLELDRVKLTSEALSILGTIPETQRQQLLQVTFSPPDK